MPIVTPRGLKVRVEVPYAFGLMARLHPRVTPFRVLKTTEGIESIPGLVTFVVALVAFAYHLSPVKIGLAVLAAHVAGVAIAQLGLFMVPGLVGLATAFSYLAGYGLLFAVLVVAGYFATSWQGVLAYLVARAGGWLLSQPLEMLAARRALVSIGHPLTQSERSFFNAYRIHAARIGVTTDLSLSDEELAESHWEPVLLAFAREWPDVARRFSD